MCIYIFSASIRAKNDIWFIGDHMVREACPYLQELQNSQDSGHANYLHSNYDTYVFYPNFTENNVLTMVRNGFIEALNKRLKMPSAVIILTSDQLIVEDPLYLPSEVDRKIKWILREIDAAIKIRKDSLPVKAYTLGEPRLMWVRAFNNTKANHVPHETLMKFNNMLRKICISKAVYTIPLNTYQQSTVRCFDFDGKTKIKDGFDLLWYDIIKGIQWHDSNDKLAEQQRIVKEHNERYDCHQYQQPHNYHHDVNQGERPKYNERPSGRSRRSRSPRNHHRHSRERGSSRHNSSHRNDSARRPDDRNHRR